MIFMGFIFFAFINLYSQAPQIDPLIQKGTITEDFPSVVALQHYSSDGKTIEFGGCTGTFFRPNAILTASHCVLNKYYINDKIPKIGTIIDTKVFAIGKKIVYTSQKSGGLWPDDIAVIIIDGYFHKQIELDSKVPEIGETVTIVGYGVSKVNGKDFGVKRESTKAVYNVALDKKLTDYRDPTTSFTNDFVQVASSWSGVIPTRGDSGSPLIYNDKIIGISSYIKINKDVNSSDNNYIIADYVHLRKYIDEINKFADNYPTKSLLDNLPKLKLETPILRPGTSKIIPL